MISYDFGADVNTVLAGLCFASEQCLKRTCMDMDSSVLEGFQTLLDRLQPCKDLHDFMAPVYFQPLSWTLKHEANFEMIIISA